MNKATLSLEQLDAILKFRTRHGRQWKNKLNAMWFNGDDARQPEAPFLRQIRNDFGPRWLSNFSFAGVLTEYKGWKLDLNPVSSVTGQFRAERMGVEVDAGDVMALGRIVDSRIQMYPSTLGA